METCRLPPDANDAVSHEYQHTLMYGRYTKELGSLAKDEAIKLGLNRKYKDDLFRNKELHRYPGKCTPKAVRLIAFLYGHSFAKLGEDWIFLALLGAFMAVLSFIVDFGVGFTNEGRLWLFKDLTKQPIAQYTAWVTLPICLILFSAGFVHLVAPQSIGSGIPEMKTILRGVALKEYLTFRTLIAKVVGLTATLGSGLPLGKEGPFVHISSIIATLLTKLISSFKSIYENESRNSEMLAAACAVGVASSFGAVIGGVLFSIEVTTVYFAVRNYWRGFFAAVCSASVFRLLAVWFNKADTVKAFFPTYFTMDIPFEPRELAVFALMGAVCGFGGALYVWTHRQYVLIMRRNKKLNNFLQRNRFLYPAIVTFITATISFPLGLGKYFASDLSTEEQFSGLFSNFTWTKEEFSIKERDVLKHWTTENTNVFLSLTAYILFHFVLSIIGSTIPVPSGSFIPVFKIGAALGRIVGELLHMQFPNGIKHGKYISSVIPGGYATVGAAAFSGAVTHSISVSVIAFEMTGQITHIIPMMISVLIANAIAALLQPSLYDSIILIKKLPYLPDLLPSNSGHSRIKKNARRPPLPLPLVCGSDFSCLIDTTISGTTTVPSVSLEPTCCSLAKSHQTNNVSKGWHNRFCQVVGKDHPDLYSALLEFRKKQSYTEIAIYTVYVKNFMLRDVIYIWYNMTYKDLKRILKENKRIRLFPLVDNPGSMILLGSVQRLELIKLIEDHVGRERRVQVVTKWQKEAQERLEELERRRRQESARRPSRFEVVPAPDMLKMKQYSSSDLMQNNKDNNVNGISFERQPKKSILKKTNSFNLRSYPNLSSTAVITPYSTVTGAESRIRMAFEAIFHKSNKLQDANPELEINNASKVLITDKPLPSPSIFKKVQLPRERVIDMSPEDQREWEEVEMEQRVNFERCHIDPAPFQLVERTSLLKVHSIFSLVGVNHAYVTAIGRLVGIVGLKELRKAIEDTNSGCPPSDPEETPTELLDETKQPNETKALLNPTTERERDRNNSDATSVNSALTNSNV